MINIFLYKIPKLEPGPLKKEILIRMRDVALNEMDIRYHTYPDGIISGCGLFEENKKIGVFPGIIKYSGRLYFLNEKCSIQYQPTDSWTVLKIRFAPQKHHPEYLWFEGNMVLDENTQILPNEVELGRFKLKIGSRLRTAYQNFEDMRTEFDTVNLINIKWSISNGYTLHPKILLEYAREAYSNTNENIYDVSFCTQVLANAGVVTKEAILRYISARNHTGFTELSNEAVFDYLASTILKRTETESKKFTTADGIYVF